MGQARYLLDSARLVELMDLLLVTGENTVHARLFGGAEGNLVACPPTQQDSFGIILHVCINSDVHNSLVSSSKG